MGSIGASNGSVGFGDRGFKWWRNRTVALDLADSVVRDRNRLAVVGYKADGTVDRLTFAELAVYVDRFACALHEHGVRRGDVVSWQLPNWWQFAALTVATCRIGAIANPIPMTLREREVRFILDRTASRLVVVPSEFRGFGYADMVRSIRPSADLFVIGGASSADEDFESYVDQASRVHEIGTDFLDSLAPDPNDVAQIQFTSGTTGEPKGVMHTHNTLDTAMRSAVVAHRLSSEDVVFMASTLGHQTGYLYGCLMPISLGATAVYQDVWAPSRALEQMRREGATWTMGATPFVLDLLDAVEHGAERPTVLKFFCCAGSPIPPHIVNASAALLGTRIMSAWGMTENGAVTLTHVEDHLASSSQSDGRPVPWAELKIVDDHGQAVPKGEVGELRVRSASQFIGYFARPDLTLECHDEDGWFRTGDLARWVSGGGIRIAGRSKDVIVRGGENIPVAEVEAALLQLPAVRDVVLVPYPDDRLQERACAVVVLAGDRASLTLSELTDHLALIGMSKQYWPERLEVLSELPRTASGKVQKFAVRRMLGFSAI